MMRFDRDSFKEIAETLSRNRSRTLLTGFGIFWGIFMLLTMLGGGNGLKSILQSNFEGFTSNTVVMGTNNTTKPYKGFKRDRYWTFNLSDLESIRRNVYEADIVTMMSSRWGQNATFGNNSYSSGVKGVSHEYAGVEAPVILYGRFLNEIDIKEARKVCVIGERIWKNLFPDESDPVGKRIGLMGTEFTVIGVNVRSNALNINGSSSESIFIPFSLMDKLSNTGGEFDLLCLTVKEGADSEAMQKKVESILRRRHSIAPDDKGALICIDTQKIFTIVDNLFKGVNILVILCGLGTLLAGAVGVSNIMLVTVKERTTEIGIRRAIGATPRMILGQILTESAALTLLAGTLGILVSTFILGAASSGMAGNPDMSGVSFQIGFWTGIGTLVLIAVLGVLAGLIPAMRAMSIKPVDAMRDE